MSLVAKTTHTIYETLDYPKKIMTGEGLPDKIVNLGDIFGEIQSVAIDNSAVTKFSWLVKAFINNKNELKERNLNLKLNSACAVTESAYSMKGRRKIIRKRKLKLEINCNSPWDQGQIGIKLGTSILCTKR